MMGILGRKVLLLAGDAVVVAGALYAAPLLRFGLLIEPGSLFVPSDLATVFVYLVVFYLFDLYNLEEGFVSGAFIVRIALAVAVAAVLVGALFFLARIPLYSLGIFLLQGALVFLFCAAWRCAYERLAKGTARPRRLAVLGAKEAGRTFGEMMRGNRDYEIVGYLDDDEATHGASVGCAPVLGGTDLLPALVGEGKIDKVIIAAGDEVSPDVYRRLVQAKFAGVNVYELPTFVEMTAGRIPVRHLSDTWLARVSIAGVRQTIYTKRLKRIGDIIVSLLLLIPATPVIALLCPLIRLDSPGPAVFRQARIGLRGKPFTLYKLRTMVTGREGEREFAGRRDDPRITRLGRILRLFRLDELPQLFNVLKGDMSFIGPRALMAEEVARFDGEIPYFSLRHAIRPGVTGWAQVNYPHGATTEDALEKLQYDLYYLKNMSLLLDLHILLRTVRVVIFGKGAR
ncbi:MAG TPA: sugar transferase [Syntrophales bacterium]|nr:sugar transferase [Syntrophales bacterium]